MDITKKNLIHFGFSFAFENESDTFYEIDLKLSGTKILIGLKGDYWICYNNGNGNGQDYESVGLGVFKDFNDLKALYNIIIK